MLLPKMLRALLAGKANFYSGSLEDQARVFRQGKGRSSSTASVASYRTSPARHRQSSWSQHSFESEISGASLVHARSTSSEDKKKENVVIGFFLHTPFPSSEIFR